MDEQGHMWFKCKAPVSVQSDEQSFPVRLHFFRKGFNYFVDVNGSASIIPTSDNEAVTTTGKEGIFLMKLNVNNIEYIEPRSGRKTWLDEWIRKAYGWLINPVIFPRNQKSFFTKLQHNR